MSKAAVRYGKRTATRLRAIRRRAAEWSRKARRALTLALVTAGVAGAPSWAEAQMGQTAMPASGGIVNRAVSRLQGLNEYGPGWMYYGVNGADRGLGYIGSYMTLGGFIPYAEDDLGGFWAADLRGHLSVNGGFFSNVGAVDDVCGGIPQGSVALGLAFWDVRREGRIVDPGAANKHLAGWIHDRRSCLSAILVQESIYVVWEEAGLLREGALEGTPVYRMHRHVKGLQPPVRTLEALACGVGRFAVPPDTLVLAAHDKQIQRALHDLESVYEGAILPARIVGVPYPAGSGGAFAWACRELYVARPLEWLQRAWGGVRCRDRVRLPPLDGRG